MLRHLASSAMRHPVPWLVAGVGFIMLCALGLLRLQLRTDGATIYPQQNQTIQQTERDKQLFKDSEEVILLLTSVLGGEPVASPKGLRTLRSLHAELARRKGVERAGVRSLASLPVPAGSEDALSGARLLDSIPTESGLFATLLRMIHEHPLADGLFLSAGGEAAALYIRLEAGQQPEPFIRDLQDWIRSWAATDFDLRLMGPLVAETTLGGIVLKDLARLVPLMILVIAVMLFLLLRTIGGVVIPLLEAAAVLLCTVGIMGYAGVPVTLVTTVLPVVLMAMAITDEIHILEKLKTHLASDVAPTSGRTAERERLRRAMTSSLKIVGSPIVMTTLTTALGFLSFLSASVSPMRHFGLFASLGILLAMVMSFTLIPALVVVLPVSWFLPREGKPGRRRLYLIFPWKVGPAAPRRIGRLLGPILLFLSFPGLMNLSVQDAWLDNFDPDSPLVTAQNDFDRTFWGSYRFDVVFHGEPGFFHRPPGVELIEEFERRALQEASVGGVVSYLVPFRSVAQALGGSDSLTALSARQLTDVAAVAEMWAGSEEIDQLLVQDGASARVRLFVRDANYKRALELRRSLESLIPGVVGTEDVTYHASGDLPVAIEVVQAIVRNQLRSIAWVLLSILVLLLLVLRPFPGALIVMVPVVTADWIIFGIMGYAGLPIGIATSMFAAITIGVGVDYALHLFHSYRYHRDSGQDHDRSLANAMAGTGRAIRWNALVLFTGFLVLAFSAVQPNRSLGLLLAGAMFACYGTTLIFVPALLRRLSLVFVLAVLACPVAAQDTQPERRPAEQPGTEEIMRRLQEDFQRPERIARIDIATEYRQGRTTRRRLWGVFSKRGEQFRILYVFMQPDVSRGTSLLMHISDDSGQSDSTWFYLPSFNNLRLVEETAYRFLVPETGLNFGDARGYLKVDRYNFERFGTPGEENETDTVILVAKPKTEAIRRNTGYDSLMIRIDPVKQLITHIDYTAVDGDSLKRYVVLESVELSDVWFPKEVQIEQFIKGTTTRMSYQYWRPAEPPENGFFNADFLESFFIDRILELLEKEGIDAE